jgi:hypothetical protein
MRLCAALLFALTVYAGKPEWKVGKITDADAQGGVLIVGEDYSFYVALKAPARSNGSLIGAGVAASINRKNHCRFVVDDMTHYSQIKDHMRVVDADGKQCDMRVLRQERLSSQK